MMTHQSLKTVGLDIENPRLDCGYIYPVNRCHTHR